MCRCVLQLISVSWGMDYAISEKYPELIARYPSVCWKLLFRLRLVVVPLVPVSKLCVAAVNVVIHALFISSRLCSFVFISGVPSD